MGADGEVMQPASVGVYKERRRACEWPVKEQREVGKRDCPRQEWRRLESCSVSDGMGEL